MIVYIESFLNWEDPILSNEPRPLMARVPIWIRPYTTIFTARARVVDQYGVQVHYQIESGELTINIVYPILSVYHWIT